VAPPFRPLWLELAGSVRSAQGAQPDQLVSLQRSAPGPTTQQVAPFVPSPQIVSRPVPGLGPNYTPMQPSPGSADLLRTYEALFGRTAIRLGPTNPRWSTFSGEMTPEGITHAIDTANAGQPFLFMDMCRRAVENDAAIGAAVELAFSRIVSEEDRTEPPRSMRRDPLAISLANWQRAVREQIEDFDRARYALLWAEGVGYSSAEIIWGHRPITWFTHDNRRVTRTYCVPVKLEIVDGRGFRFDIEEDRPYLWLDGDYRELPPAKFIWHESYRVTSVRERGGFMRACLFLHAIKQWAWRDMAEYLHMYGLPQMVVEFDRKLYNYEEARAIARQLMEFMGQGGVPTVPLGISLRTDTPPPQWALVHGDAAKLMNQEIFRRIVLGLLLMTEGGGNYGLGDVHAEGAFQGTRLRANNLCGSMRRHLWAPSLAMNVLRLVADVDAGPAEIMCALPEYSSRLLREDTPEKRQAIFSQAMRDGCKVSATQYRAELQLDEPKDDDDVLEGEAVSVPSQGAVVSAVKGSEGAAAPQPPAQERQLPPHTSDAAAASEQPKETP
jgi:phage gp29-like protein